jgi:hypothetical protein
MRDVLDMMRKVVENTSQVRWIVEREDRRRNGDGK